MLTNTEVQERIKADQIKQREQWVSDTWDNFVKAAEYFSVLFDNADDKMVEVTHDWVAKNLTSLPSYIPSFDEFVADLRAAKSNPDKWHATHFAVHSAIYDERGEKAVETTTAKHVELADQLVEEHNKGVKS